MPKSPPKIKPKIEIDQELCTDTCVYLHVVNRQGETSTVVVDVDADMPTDEVRVYHAPDPRPTRIPLTSKEPSCSP